MFDCASDIVAYHDDKVTLLRSQRTEMRDRRNRNRERLLTRLKANEMPVPQKFIKQGSYAMLTMVQDSNNDYDIDDGVYFTQVSLRDKHGNDMSAEEARQMVCDALQYGPFSKQPEMKKNCVRIFYSAGYHVDMPVYRIRDLDGEYELACGDKWILSRAADVENWFDKTNRTRSPDEINGRQFRRIVRILKKFARSRDSWKETISGGFTITKLAEECYEANKEREDIALRDTMRSMRDRLIGNLEVRHPVTPGSLLTTGPNDSTTKFLRDKLEDALRDLQILDEQDCTRKQALAAWDEVYDTNFFSSRCQDQDQSSPERANSGILSGLVATRRDPEAVDKRGGGRFA